MLDGKIANQLIPRRFGSNRTACACSCCQKLIPGPRGITVQHSTDYYSCYMYDPQSQYFIYESKSGIAACYCSDRCRRKHNHRFRRK